jgi:hypothetical protein
VAIVFYGSWWIEKKGRIVVLVAMLNGRGTISLGKHQMAEM